MNRVKGIRSIPFSLRLSRSLCALPSLRVRLRRCRSRAPESPRPPLPPLLSAPTRRCVLLIQTPPMLGSLPVSAAARRPARLRLLCLPTNRRRWRFVDNKALNTRVFANLPPNPYVFSNTPLGLLIFFFISCHFLSFPSFSLFLFCFLFFPSFFRLFYPCPHLSGKSDRERGFYVLLCVRSPVACADCLALASCRQREQNGIGARTPAALPLLAG